MTDPSSPSNPFQPSVLLDEYPRIWSPSPPEVQTLPLETVGFLARSLAYLLDRLLLSMIGLLFLLVGLVAQNLDQLSSGDLFSLENLWRGFLPTWVAMFFVRMFYYTFFLGYTGQTVGKMVCGLKVVGKSGEIIGYRRAFLRWIGYGLSAAILYLGFIWVIFDPDNQGWHDKLAGTFVTRI